jgi:hypothetical protein
MAGPIATRRDQVAEPRSDNRDGSRVILAVRRSLPVNPKSKQFQSRPALRKSAKKRRGR